jgi:nucleoid DNA-binding protein
LDTLNPKKAKELIKPTAQELGVSESLVKDATDFYWGELRKNLSNLESPNIYVAGLGSFVIAPKKLAVMKQKYQNMVMNLGDADTFRKFTVKQEAETRLEKITKIFKKIDENIEKKKQIRLSRNGKTE